MKRGRLLGNKGCKQWLWLAMNRATREIIGVHVRGPPSRRCPCPLALFTPVYRQCAVCHTDFWEADVTVIVSRRHRAVGKESGQTNHIKRFNCTLRQRVSRLVRSTLSFSKKLENHIEAIWYLIHHYNVSLQL